ncbi:MAG: TetR/AcrR family transcriptional regulator [Spirochaetes bacterium]|nr:TetR/AcrR family transcriptional regulator [Spirochaetota bacterium]
MPKVPRTVEEINNVKERILDTALRLIIEEGFPRLSMRKIASRLGITATTIYNYFASKDELYFMIRIHGFELLYSSFEEAYEENGEPRERLRAMIGRYVRFGIDYPDYYDVMFLNRTVPKYLECVGTPLEPVASRDLEMGLKTLSVAVRVLKELNEGDREFDDDEGRFRAIQLWCDMNGIIALRNSRLLNEVETDMEGLIGRLTDEVWERFRE